MKKRNPQLFLEDADGNRVPVSDKVYRAYWRFTNKEDYFMRQLKEERFLYDPEKRIAEFIPSREDSLERLLEEGEDFASERKSVEDTVIDAISIRELWKNATEEERRIACLALIAEATEEEASALLHLTRTTYQRKRDALFGRWAKELNDTS